MLTFTVSTLTLRVMLSFDDVIRHFGGTHQSLASALGISRTAVTMWGGQIPELRAMQIEVVTGGKLRASELPVKRPASRVAA